MTDGDSHRAIAARIGEALIEWSRVEHLWANIFRDLLFDGIGEKPEIDPETRSPGPTKHDQEKDDRADALFFSQKNSQIQFTMIEAVGKVSLAGQAELLRDFDALLKETRRHAQTRNSIAHAYYDSRVLFNERGGFEITPVQPLGFGRFKKAPDIDLLAERHAFAQLADKVFAFWRLLFEEQPLWKRP